MDELKNLKNYNEFKDSLNEELLWGAIKQLFSTIFGKIDKQLADAVANFTKKLDGSKSWEESLKYYEESTKVQLQNVDQDLQTITGPLGLRKIIADNATVTFVTLLELSNKYGSPDVAPKKIFEGQPEAEMFNFDKSQDFNNNLLASSNAKMLQLNKDSQNPYNETELKTYLDNNKDVNVIEQKPNVPSDQSAENNKIRGNSTESFIYNDYKDKLNEEVDGASTPSPNTGTPTAGTSSKNVPKGEIAKMKDPTKNWVNTNLLGHSLTKVKQVKPPAKVGNADAFDTVAKGSKATNLHNNLANLLRNIVNIQDKAKLMQVRDATAKALGKDPKEFLL